MRRGAVDSAGDGDDRQARNDHGEPRAAGGAGAHGSGGAPRERQLAHAHFAASRNPVAAAVDAQIGCTFVVNNEDYSVRVLDVAR